MKSSDMPWSSDTPTFKLITGTQALMIKHSVFTVMTELIAERLFMLFFVRTLCDGLKMSEYEAYWLMDFLLINI